jgi:protein gp37
MAENSKIEWTTHTFNPWRGCTKVHAGCTNCYAETLSGRNPGTLGTWGPNGTRVVAAESAWREPLKWGRHAHDTQAWHSANSLKDAERPRVFCASLADVFEDWQGPVMHHAGGQMINCPKCGWEPFMGNDGYDGCENKWLTLDDVRVRLFNLPPVTERLDWLALTKRPELIRATIDRTVGVDWWKENCPNVWLGTSVSDQPTADEYAKRLRECRDLSPVLFLSVEPLLGPINNLPLDGIDWVIVGGESGPKARPCNIEWIRSIREQCKAAGVPCFVKQLGSRIEIANDEFSEWPRKGDGLRTVPDDYIPSYQGEMVDVRTEDKKGGDWSEWPESLRVREFPSITST